MSVSSSHFLFEKHNIKVFWVFFILYWKKKNSLSWKKQYTQLLCEPVWNLGTAKEYPQQKIKRFWDNLFSAACRVKEKIRTVSTWGQQIQTANYKAIGPVAKWDVSTTDASVPSQCQNSKNVTVFVSPRYLWYTYFNGDTILLDQTGGSIYNLKCSNLLLNTKGRRRTPSTEEQQQ